MNEQQLRPIKEANYLTTQNAWRYRAILHYFYEQHESLRHFLFPEEVYHYLKQIPHFHAYTEEQLEQDLQQLVEWDNLIPRQETGKVSSIEEFKKKKYRYQCTPYTVEIERMVKGLEQLGDSFGGSLERTLFDRLLELLTRLTASETSSFDAGTDAMEPRTSSFDTRTSSRDGANGSEDNRYQALHMPAEQLNRLWEDLHAQFKQLTENATDYLAYLKSEQVEEAMMTEAFLSYKDAITEYLRNFMTALQRASLKIETLLQSLPGDVLTGIVRRIVDYQMSIPRLEEEQDPEELRTRYLRQWDSIQHWFLGAEGRGSEILFLQNETTETIRRMTRFAQRLGERHHNLRSRRQDYIHLAKWFDRLETLEEAHELSACVFGVFHTRHLYAGEKQTEDIDADIWEQPATVLTIKPRIRNYREKTKPGAVISRQKEKEELYEHYLREKEAEQRLLEQLISQNRIVVSDLAEVDPYIRKTLLQWIAKAMSNTHQVAKTETGRRFKLMKMDERTITLKAQDGRLQMPNYVISFLE